MHAPSESATADGSGPFTVVAAWTIRPGKETAFEQWHRGLSAVASRFPGHMGVSVMRPTTSRGEYLVIFRFDTYENLLAWQESSERQAWLEKAAPLRAEETRYQSGYGIEFWFTSPHAGSPPRWKMAALTTLIIYLLVNLLNILLNPLLGALSPFAGSLVVTVIIVLLMTYLVMPAANKIFANWLYTKAKGDP